MYTRDFRSLTISVKDGKIRKICSLEMANKIVDLTKKRNNDWGRRKDLGTMKKDF